MISVLRAVLSGCFCALLLASSAFGLPIKIIYNNFIPVPILYVGLRWGITEAIIASTSASILFMGSGAAGNLSILSFLVLSVFPALILTYYTTQGSRGPGTEKLYPVGTIITRLLFYSTTVAALLSFIFCGGNSRFVIGFSDIYDQVEISVLYGFSGAVIPVTIGCSLLLKTSLFAFLVQALLAKQGNSIRPSIRVEEIFLPWWLWYGLLLSILLSLLLRNHWIGLLCLDALFIVLVAFLFEGLGVIHTVLQGVKGKSLTLVIFYSLLLLTVIPMIIMIAIGIFEPWIRLRERRFYT